MTNDFSWTSRSPNNQGFTGTSSDDGWSGFMNSLNIGGRDDDSRPTRTYSWTITFNNYGRQRFDTAVDDTGDVFINGAYQFSMGGFNGQTSRTTPGFFAPGTYTISATSVNSGGGPWGIALDWTGFIPPPPATINSFSANPNPQTSNGGTPLYSTTLFWNSTNGVSATITSSAGESFNVSPSGSLNITNLPQSTAGSNSPATRTYTLTVRNIGNQTATSTITVSAYNDNTPSSLTTNGQAVAFSGSKPLTALEPNTTYYTRIFISGVDMNVIASPAGSGITVGTNTSNWTSGNKLVTLTQPLYVRWTSMPFNTSTTPGGTNGDGLVIGQTNSKTITCSVGSRSISFTATTRAPVIEEVFNLESINTNNNSPFPDIDTISDTPTPSTFQYAQTGEITANDIEIDNEIKTNSPDAQVQINNTGVWRDMRQI